jgi:hypothetical protein
VELLDLGIKIVKDGYSVGNTEYDVGTLRFKDFIRMVNFFWAVWLPVMVLGNQFGFFKSSQLRKNCFRLGSMKSCQRYPWT